MTAGASQMGGPLNAVGAQRGASLAGVARLAGDRLGVSRWPPVTREQV
jgi:hypothetical protein